MNPIIEKQLKKVKAAKLGEYDSNTYEFLIPQNLVLDEQLIECNKSYLIQLKPSILNPTPDSSFAANWNKNITPKTEFLQCTVNQIMNNMIQIDAIGYDMQNKQILNDTYINLWLPRTEFTIIDNI